METYYVGDHSLGDVINALNGAGLQSEFLQESPLCRARQISFMEQGEDGWWRLPPHQQGTIPFLFSLQARKPA